MKKISFAIVALVAILGFSNCTKNNTTTTNNAFSITTDINPSDWKYNSGNATASFVWNVGNNVLPADGNNGAEAVLMYLAQVNSDGSITEYDQLPTTNYGYQFYPIHSPGQIVIDINSADANATSLVLPTLKFYLKVIIIDAVALKSSGVNTQNYSAVKAAFHLN